jgi:hypothetical protein
LAEDGLKQALMKQALKDIHSHLVITAHVNYNLLYFGDKVTSNVEEITYQCQLGQLAISD